MPKVLVLQTGFLGDLALNLPLVRELADYFAPAEVDIVVRKGFEGVPESCPWINKVHSYDKRGSQRGLSSLFTFAKNLKREGYTHLVSLHKSARSSLLSYLTEIPVRIGFKESSFSFAYTNRVKRVEALHELYRNESILSPFNIRLQSLNCELSIGESTKQKFALPDDYVCVAPGSVWETKKWRGFNEVCDFFAADGKEVVLIGAPSDVPDAEGLEGINLVGKTNVKEVVEIIGNSSFLVCNDSAAGHIAALFDIPSVVVFCATSPLFGFYPTSAASVTVGRDDLSCRPCSRHGLNSCPTGTKECIDGLPAEAVIYEINKFESSRLQVI